VFDALAAADLTLVTVEFDGEGDSGQINAVTAYAGEAPAEFPSTALTLHQATQMEAILELPKRRFGTRFKPSATTISLNVTTVGKTMTAPYGTFEFDVPNRGIHLDIDERFTDTTNSTHDTASRIYLGS